MDSEESLVFDLLGKTESGDVVAGGRPRLPVEGGCTIGKFLTRVLSAHALLRSRPNRHANANGPWAQSLDEELTDAWLHPGGEDGAV